MCKNNGDGALTHVKLRRDQPKREHSRNQPSFQRPIKNSPWYDKIGVVVLGRSRDVRRNDMSPVTSSSISCPKNPNAVCPLHLVRAGVSVRIKQLCAAPDVTQRLREIGLGEDQTIRLVASKNNIICQVCNARLAISSELAQAILVEPLGFAFPA